MALLAEEVVVDEFPLNSPNLVQKKVLWKLPPDWTTATRGHGAPVTKPQNPCVQLCPVVYIQRYQRNSSGMLPWDLCSTRVSLQSGFSYGPSTRRGRTNPEDARIALPSRALVQTSFKYPIYGHSVQNPLVLCCPTLGNVQMVFITSLAGGKTTLPLQYFSPGPLRHYPGMLRYQLCRSVRSQHHVEHHALVPSKPQDRLKCEG